MLVLTVTNSLKIAMVVDVSVDAETKTRIGFNFFNLFPALGHQCSDDGEHDLVC